MYCEKCGTELQDDSTFCGNCGEKTSITPEFAPAVNAAPPVIKEGFKFQSKHFVIIGSVLAVLVIAAVAFFIFMNTGRRYLYSAVKKSISVYAGEINKIIDTNPVLKTMESNFSKPYINEVEVTGVGSFTFTDDKKSKIYELGMDIGGLTGVSLEAGAYLSNDKLIAGSPDVVYLEANPKALGSGLRDLIDNFSNIPGYEISNADSSAIEQLADLLDTYDFSYDNIQKGTIFKDSPDFNEINKLAVDLVYKLIERAAYEKTNSDLEIGGKTVKTSRVTLTAGPDEIGAWLTDDVLPALKTSEAMKKYWDMIYDYGGYYGSYGGIYMDYDDMLDESESGIDEIVEQMEDYDISIVAGAEIYKGTIVSLEGWVFQDGADDEDEAPGFVISAVGDPYRLNEINIAFYDTGHDYSDEIEISGNYFSPETFEADVAYKNGDYTERASLEWDLTDDNDNFVIEDGYQTISFTLYTDENTVVGEFPMTNWTFEAFDGSVTLPDETVTMQDFSVEDVFEKLQDFNALQYLF